MNMKKLITTTLLSVFILGNTAIAGEQDLSFSSQHSSNKGSGSHVCGSDKLMINNPEKRVNFQLDDSSMVDTSNSGLFSDYDQ